MTRSVIVSTQYTQHESLNKEQVLTRLPDMGTITDKTMVNTGHIYIITYQGNWNQVCVMRQFKNHSLYQ